MTQRREGLKSEGDSAPEGEDPEVPRFREGAPGMGKPQDCPSQGGFWASLLCVQRSVLEMQWAGDRSVPPSPPPGGLPCAWGCALWGLGCLLGSLLVHVPRQ